MSRKKMVPPKDDLPVTFDEVAEPSSDGPNTIKLNEAVEAHVPRLDGDVTAEDWKEVLGGVSWEDYTRVVADKYISHPNYDRNDMFRPHFNRIAPAGSRTAADVEAFYRSDFWCRLLAYECIKEGMLRSLIDQYTTPEALLEAPLAGFLSTYDEYKRKHEGDETAPPFRVLDHGCGRGEFALAALWLRPDIHVVCCDFKTPARELLQLALSKYMSWANAEFCWVGEADYEALGPYDYINSQEVLEHVWDPVNEACKLVRSAKAGAVLHISTFFNDCGGRNPSHLSEHHKYQDTELWFSVLTNIGLSICGYDPRGIVKLFRKVDGAPQGDEHAIR